MDVELDRGRTVFRVEQSGYASLAWWKVGERKREGGKAGDNGTDKEEQDVPGKRGHFLRAFLKRLLKRCYRLYQSFADSRTKVPYDCQRYVGHASYLAPDY